MKIILTQDLENLGAAGDVVDVKPGYARNYLLPRQMGLVANKGNQALYEEVRQQRGAQVVRELREAEQKAEALSKASVNIAVSVGEEDRIFGSVTSQQITDLLNEQGLEIDRRSIQLVEPIRALGVYDVPVRLHPGVDAKVKVWVVKE
jgi:large subunit ribosomal protein L9